MMERGESVSWTGRDLARWGVHERDITDNYIGPQSFKAIFASLGHLTNVGRDKQALMDFVADAVYGGNSNCSLIESYIKRARPVYCEGIRKYLFPDSGPRPDPRSQDELFVA